MEIHCPIMEMRSYLNAIGFYMFPHYNALIYVPCNIFSIDIINAIWIEDEVYNNTLILNTIPRKFETEDGTFMIS